MELDPDDVFRDEEVDSDNEFILDKEPRKEFAVYLIDASPKMLSTLPGVEEDAVETHFHVALNCVSHALKAQIINRSDDEVAVCFFNTREKKNLQDLSGVFVFNVPDRESVDSPTARFIKEFDNIEESFSKDIGSQYGILPGSRENTLYNALWVAQGLLRKGSGKTSEKRILLFTNEDDPFGSIKGLTKLDMTRTTIQRAKDAQDLGISIELLPLSLPDEQFNVSHFYADLLGLEDESLDQFLLSAGERFEDMAQQINKRMFKKRKVKRISFAITNDLRIELNMYALIRPTLPGSITWLDSVTNLPLKSEREFICGDTGAIVQRPSLRFHPYQNKNVMFTSDEISGMKRISTGHLRLLGFKPLIYLRDYHNLRPSTFLFPSDEELGGSTCIFVALYRSMLQFKRFAVAFFGGSAYPRLVALIAQDEITSKGGQLEPPGLYMIYLPYSDDIRNIEELHSDALSEVPRASDNQIKVAEALIKRIDLKDFSVCQFSNPVLQRHYAVLQALALDEDEMPEMIDETEPDEEGMARPGVMKAVEEFKLSVYGRSYDAVEDDGKAGLASKKRKLEYTSVNWRDLADRGNLANLTAVELQCYLVANNLPIMGKKDDLIKRILAHLSKDKVPRAGYW